MGKQARERKERQRLRMRDAAVNDPEHFALRWEGKLRGYVDDIWAARNSGKKAVFSIARSAIRELSGLGEGAMDLYGSWTKALLENEACKAVASAVGPELYHLNRKLEKNN